MRQQMEQTVMRAVEALPEELREAITLREVDGLSYEEIAERMDCPIGTVRSRIFRAREAIDAGTATLAGQREPPRSVQADDAQRPITNARHPRHAVDGSSTTTACSCRR